MTVSSGRVMDGEPLAGQQAVVSAPVAPSRPSWMKPQRAATKPPKTAAPPLVAIDPTVSALPATPATWSGRLAANVFRVTFGMGWLVSGLIHLTLLTTLGLLAYQTQTKPPTEITGVFGVPGSDTVLDIDSSMDAGGSLAPINFETVGVTNVVDPTGSGSSPLQVLGSVDGRIGGDGLGDGGSGSGGLGSISGNLRVPASAVTKGSFTAWTEPEDPEPLQPYEIVIQVKLPPEVKGYRLRDLTGHVTGTDNFHLDIKYKSTDRKAVKDGVVQVRVFVLGAKIKATRDTIVIRSAILKEEQTIEIVF